MVLIPYLVVKESTVTHVSLVCRLIVNTALPQRAKKENAKLKEQLEKQRLQKEREVRMGWTQHSASELVDSSLLLCVYMLYLLPTKMNFMTESQLQFPSPLPHSFLSLSL